MTESIGKAKLWMSDCGQSDDDDDDYDDDDVDDDENWWKMLFISS